jgi:hypothetical protein
LRVALILAAIVFVMTLLVRLPARALLWLLPPDVACDDAGGTVWHGTCDQLRSDGISIAGVAWRLHPLSLLSLSPRAELSSVDPNAGGSASVELALNGDATLADVHVSLPLTAAMHLLPAGGTAILVVALPSAKIRAQHLVAVQGTLDLQQLHVANPPADLGSYRLQFAPAGADRLMIGQFRDLSGPLAVTGQLRLQPSGAFEIDGTVAARPSASNDLNQALQMLGPADSRGQHPLSLAGTL